MKSDQEEMTGALYSECYEASQKATREALREYDLSGIDRDSLSLDTKNNKKSLVYKLFSNSGIDKVLIATTKVNIATKVATVKVTGLDKNG